MKSPKQRKLINNLAQRVKRRGEYLEFSRKFGQIGFRPNYLQLIKVFLFTFPRKSDFFNFATHKAILREWSANRFPEDLSFDETELPTIEILIVAAGKDIELLPSVLKAATSKTLNPVSKITLIIPNADQIQCKETVSRTNFESKIEIIPEDDVLSDSIREKIKSKFKNRYGWVLQQLLALEYILMNKSLGVLLLDADTLLLQEVAWLNSDKHQKLMVGYTYHKPYHDLLNKLINSDLVPKTTHVTHHMLIQPNYLREIFKNFNLIDVENLLDLLVELSDHNEESALSVDFELYSQAMLKLHPDKLQLRKFSNISVARSQVSDMNNLEIEFANYNSISMHSYLESESNL